MYISFYILYRTGYAMGTILKHERLPYLKIEVMSFYENKQCLKFRLPVLIIVKLIYLVEKCRNCKSANKNEIKSIFQTTILIKNYHVGGSSGTWSCEGEGSQRGCAAVVQSCRQFTQLSAGQHQWHLEPPRIPEQRVAPYQRHASVCDVRTEVSPPLSHHILWYDGCVVLVWCRGTQGERLTSVSFVGHNIARLIR